MTGRSVAVRLQIAGEVKLWTAFRGGELLAGTTFKKNQHDTAASTLEGAGLTYQDSHRWQRIYSLGESGVTDVLGEKRTLESDPRI